jgi:hypothetical protein
MTALVMGFSYAKRTLQAVNSDFSRKQFSDMQLKFFIRFSTVRLPPQPAHGPARSPPEGSFDPD